MEAGSANGENGQENGAPAFGDVVTMSARYLLNEPMGPEHAELSADRRRTPPAVRLRRGFAGVERFLQVAAER